MEENDGGVVRFRLVFDDSRLLDKSLRSQGLRRSWFLLKPGISTVGKLASDIRESFGLHDRIVLFMDDFVLPSFESTSLITEKDIITVKKRESKQKNTCQPCDGERLMQDSQIARVLDLPFISHDRLSDDKSQKPSQSSGSFDKEKMISCTEFAVQVDPPADVGLIKRKRKHSKKLLSSNGQSEENNHDQEFEPSNSPDVIKNDVHKKQASILLTHHSSDGEGGGEAFAVQSGHAHIQSQVQDAEYTPQQVDATQPLNFDGGCMVNRTITNKEKNLPQTAHVGDGLLPIPIPKPFSTSNVRQAHKQVVHFESLPPLHRLPMKGDVIVYRFAKPSSSKYPEFSSPQVAKVLSFECTSHEITLQPVLDYEILIGNQNGSIVQNQIASWNEEDFLIEVNYSSLCDVRLMKPLDLEEAACQKDSAKKDSWEEAIAKESGNEHNALPAVEQSNEWTQWIPKKSAAPTTWPSLQPNAPFSGRNIGRKNWAANRNMNGGSITKNMANSGGFSRPPTNWNAKRCSVPGNAPGVAHPFPYRAPGPPHTHWDPNYKNFPSKGCSYGSGGNQ